MAGNPAALETYKRHVDAVCRTAVEYKESEQGEADRQPFDEMQVRVVQELVTLGVGMQDGVEPRRHMSPHEFREALLNTNNDTVLLDVRNKYESDIGHFVQQGGGVALRPPMRQFTAFADYCQKQRNELEGKQVLMYCTGGIRCEKAAMYLEKEFGANTAQLHGGIHTFLDTYPDGGGVWRGRNLVFDHRLTLGPPDRIGNCVVCSTVYGSYDQHARCSRCRVRLILCAPCAAAAPKLHCGACTL